MDSQFHDLFAQFMDAIEGLDDDLRLSVHNLLQARLESILAAVQVRQAKHSAGAPQGAGSAPGHKGQVLAQPGPSAAPTRRHAAPPSHHGAAGAGHDLSDIELALFDRVRSHGAARELFLSFDQVGSGTLSSDEFLAASNSLGVYLYPKEVTTLMAKYDGDGDGGLDYSEFVTAAEASVGQWATTSGVQGALAGRPAPLNPTDIPLKASRAEELLELVSAIRSKIAQHHRTASDAFLSMNRLGDAQLTVRELHRGLVSYGLRVPGADLRCVVRAYMGDSKKRFLTVGEFGAFIAGQRPLHGGHFAPIAAQKPFLVPAGSTDTSAIAVVVKSIKAAGQQAAVAFRKFDRSGSGAISPAELRLGLLSLGHNVDLTTAQAVVKQFDASGDGQLQYREMLALLQSVRGAGGGGRYATSSLVRQRAAASASRRSATSGAAARAALTAGAPAPAPASTPAVPITAPTARLLRSISDAVYTSSLGAGKLYKTMKRHGQLGVHASDLVYGLHKVGVALSPSASEGLVAAFDEDRDGQLSLSEWLHLLSRAKAASM